MVGFRIKRFGGGNRVRIPAQPASVVVRLPDGRTIGIEEYGDPDGPVVLYFHGWPACRLEAGLIDNLPVRLLAFDRPGYGRSTQRLGRMLLDWPRDVAFVADRLSLRSFSVVGLSGGAPYAAACAYALGGRVRALALVSPVPPSAGVPHRTPGIGHLFRMGRHPKLARRLLMVLRPLLHRRIITPSMVVGGGLPAADRAVLTPEVLGRLGHVWRQAFARGIQGALSDAEIYAQDWGVPLHAIRTPTSIWYGGQDSLIPESALVPYGSIPGVRWHVIPNEGHYSLALRNSAAVLEELAYVGQGQLSSSLSQ